MFTLRRATRADVPPLSALIPLSVRALSAGHYSAAQIEAAIEQIFGVDTALIDDGTYVVAAAAGTIVGAGGWSRRRKLFGGDRWPGPEANRSPSRRVERRGTRPSRLGGRFSGGGRGKGNAPDDRLDPATEAARIRAFYVDPGWARRGIGRAILHRCESEARAEGFLRAELLATLPGVPLYAAMGYAAIEPAEIAMAGGLTLPGLRMGKALAAP